MTLDQGSDWAQANLEVPENAAVLAAAEGGDRVLRLLAWAPRRVAAVDRNPAQLHLLEFKLAAVKALGHGEYLELVGLRACRRRRALYQRVRWLLPRETDDFWLSRLGDLDRGPALQGSFERRLASFRHFVRLVHGRRKVERFLTLRSEADRRAMYAGEWQTFLWRRFGAALWKRWFSAPASQLERLLFDGRLLAPPPDLGEADFLAAKERANRVLVVHESPEAYVRSLPPESIDAFVLGRLELNGLEGEIDRVARPGATAVFVTERPEPAWTRRFVAEKTFEDAGFFPGRVMAGSFCA